MAKPIRTKEELNRRLKEVEATANGTHEKCFMGRPNNERAHYLQDMILRDVLVGIANEGCKDPQGLAGRALEVFNIEFSRWYA